MTRPHTVIFFSFISVEIRVVMFKKFDIGLILVVFRLEKVHSCLSLNSFINPSNLDASRLSSHLYEKYYITYSKFHGLLFVTLQSTHHIKRLNDQDDTCMHTPKQTRS